jgi:hypothetical protein
VNKINNEIGFGDFSLLTIGNLNERGESVNKSKG